MSKYYEYFASGVEGRQNVLEGSCTRCIWGTHKFGGIGNSQQISPFDWQVCRDYLSDSGLIVDPICNRTIWWKQFAGMRPYVPYRKLFFTLFLRKLSTPLGRCGALHAIFHEISGHDLGAKEVSRSRWTKIPHTLRGLINSKKTSRSLHCFVFLLNLYNIYHLEAGVNTKQEFSSVFPHGGNMEGCGHRGWALACLFAKLWPIFWRTRLLKSWKNPKGLCEVSNQFLNFFLHFSQDSKYLVSRWRFLKASKRPWS